MILGRAAVYTQTPESLGERIVVRRHEPGLARRAEVLRGVETEAADCADGARAPPRNVVRADGLRRVLYDGQAARLARARNLFRLRALAVEMHGHDCTRAFRQHRFDARGAYVVG